MKTPPERIPRRASRRRPVIARIIARLNVGGPAKHVVWLNDGLRGQFDSVLITGTVPEGEEDMSSFAAPYRVRRVVIPELSREIGIKDLVVVFKLFRILRRLQPDLVHTHTAKAGTVGRVAGLLYRWFGSAGRRCLFVHTYHGHVFHSYYGRFATSFFLLIERVLARLATDRIVVVSPQQREEISSHYRVGRPEQFQIVPLGLDLDLFERAGGGPSFRQELEIEPDEMLVTIVGRLTEVKNHRMFLRSVESFNREEPALAARTRFAIVGEGSLREPLEREAERMRLDNVTFAGLRLNPEAFYAASDLVVLTSLNEGTPLTLIEAMAAGVPVVSTAVGGVVDLAGSVIERIPDRIAICERGILVPSNDPRAFGRAMAFALKNPEIRSQMALRARRFVLQQYSKSRLLSDISSLYQALLTADRPLPDRGSSTAVGG